MARPMGRRRYGPAGIGRSAVRLQPPLKRAWWNSSSRPGSEACRTDPVVSVPSIGFEPTTPALGEHRSGAIARGQRPEALVSLPASVVNSGNAPVNEVHNVDVPYALPRSLVAEDGVPAQGRTQADAAPRPQPPDPRRNAVGSRFDPSRPRIGLPCVLPPAGQHRAVCGRRRRTKASYAQDIGRSTLGRGDAPRRGTPHGPAAIWAGRHRPQRSAPTASTEESLVELIEPARQRGLPN